jgi:hypothetical protein
MRFFPILLLCFFSSVHLKCTQDDIGLKSYSTYLKDEKNGLLKRCTSGSLLFELSYLTPEMLIYQKLSAGDIKKADFENSVRDAAEFTQFALAIKSSRPGESVREALKRVADENAASNEAVQNLIAYGLQQNLSLVSSTDSLLPVFYQYIPNGTIGNAYNAVLAFERKSDRNALQSGQEFTVRISPCILNKETITFTIKENDILQLPKLTI